MEEAVGEGKCAVFQEHFGVDLSHFEEFEEEFVLCLPIGGCCDAFGDSEVEVDVFYFVGVEGEGFGGVVFTNDTDVFYIGVVLLLKAHNFSVAILAKLFEDFEYVDEVDC